MKTKSQRFALWIAVTGMIAGMSSLAPSSVRGQAAGTTLRTPWGDPDLQGIWSNLYVTPLERPQQFGTREFLTKDEIAAEERRLVEQSKGPGRDSREANGTEKDVARAYNEHWFGDPSLRRGTRTSMIVDPPDGRIPPLTAEAKQRIATKREYLAALLQGTSGGRPGPISPRRSESSPDYNLDRMNRSDGPEDRSARGRWEGDTLVVDITNFNQRSEFQGSRENLHLIERYRRVDADTLSFQVTIEDPTTWTKPWTAVQTLKKNSDQKNQVYEGGCHEGNYGMIGMLANTRAAEKAFAEGRGPDPATQDNATGGTGRRIE